MEWLTYIGIRRAPQGKRKKDGLENDPGHHYDSVEEKKSLMVSKMIL